jgi:hypothetical protein
MGPMTDWSTDNVLALAPDSGSAAAGQGLASARNWTGLGASDRAIWGLCQGSGKNPYQTRIDLGEPAFKCSCPSRKFPCKHGLGLLLLYASKKSTFPAASEPDWVSEWLASRSERVAAKVEKAKAAEEAPVDPKAQAKRAAQRQARVEQGVAECRTWLEDVVRTGLAGLQGDAVSVCDRVAARMVDAQAPGLAAAIRRVPEVMASGAGWEARTLELLGRLHLLLAAAEKLADLPPALAGDVRIALGYTQGKEEVLAGQGVADRWTVIGQNFEHDDRGTSRRLWLWGSSTQRPALIADFAAGNQSFDLTLVPGMVFDGELAFFASGSPLRALVKTRGDAAWSGSTFAPLEQHTIAANLQRCAAALSQNPWLLRWPLLLPATRLARAGDGWLLQQAGETLPLAPAFMRGLQLWRLLAATGGRPATIIAEWDGLSAEPVGVFTAEQAAKYIELVTRQAA